MAFSSIRKLNVALFILFNMDLLFADTFKDEDIQRNTRDRIGMWFGPRLGKRSLQMIEDRDREAVNKMLEAADAVKYYYDQLQYYGADSDDPDKVSKKVIFTPKLGRALMDDKTLEVDFTPRLGRRRSAAGSNEDYDLYHSGNEPKDKIETRSHYFSPRLGRGGTMNFSPRLGRNLIYDLYPEPKVRVTRSANKTKTT